MKKALKKAKRSSTPARRAATQQRSPAKAKLLAKSKAPAKAKAPAKTKVPAKAKASAKAKAPAKAKASAKAKAKQATGVRSVGALLDRVAFTMFQVEDAKRARAFYEELLGLERGLASPEGTWTEYDLPGGGCLALFRHPAGTFAPSGGASLAFEVADLDSLNVRLRSAGVRYTSDVIRGPHCRMSTITDSEGNALILHELDPR